MSQLSTATTIARRAPAKGSAARELRVLTAADATGSPWFPILVVALLVAGLAGVLALNTTMARDSFEVGRLEARSAELSDTREALVHEVDAQSSPQHLAERARSLGMVPADSAAFVDLTEGTVLGVAKKAKQPEGFSVDAAARPTGGSAPAAAPTPPADQGTAPQAGQQKQPQKSTSTSQKSTKSSTPSKSTTKQSTTASR